MNGPAGTRSEPSAYELDLVYDDLVAEGIRVGAQSQEDGVAVVHALKLVTLSL